MRQSTLFRVLLLSLLFAFLLGTVTFFALRSANQSSSVEMRRHFTLFLAQTIESGPYAETIRNPRLHGGRHAPPARSLGPL